MKIFISWSGERSRQVAELLSNWVQCVLQAVDPWLSSKDIDRGSLWFSEITNQLSNTQNGIVCLTKSNLNKPWILFESGALAKGLNSSRVYTFLIDLTSNDIKDPLAQFNHTLPTKDGLYQLVRTINNSLDNMALKENILSNVFETYWPQFDTNFKEIIKNTKEEEVVVPRPKDDILNEILYSVRGLDKRVRSIEEIEYLNRNVVRHSSNITNNSAFRKTLGKHRNVWVVPIEEIPFTDRTIKELKNLNISCLEDFIKRDPDRIPLISQNTRDEVTEFMEQIG